MSNSSKKLSNRKKQKESKGESNDESVEEEDIKFSDILKKKWRVFRVSPLYNFSFSKLKSYERKLNAELSSRKKWNSYVCYKSMFSENENLELNNQCFAALEVKVMKDESQTVYLGHFISWNTTSPAEEESLSLPILLVEARFHEAQAIHIALCKMFDCDIQSVTLSLHALVSFFVKLLEIPRDDMDVSAEIITLEYGFLECETKDKIKITLELEATVLVLALVMDDLRKKFTEITNMEIMWNFYGKILNHIYHVFNLDLSFAELKKVTFPEASLTNDGQLQVYTNHAAIYSLNVLEHFTPLDAITSL